MQDNNDKSEKIKRNPNKKVELTLRHQLTPLTDDELLSQSKNISNFLKLVHPHVAESGYSDAAIELRPVKRDNDEFEFVPSFSAFKLTSEKDEEMLMKLLTGVNGKGFCVFYSIFAFDYRKDVYKANGELFTKGHVNKENPLFTTTLVADFDGITASEFNEQKQMFNKVGLNTYDVSTGHGYHSLIFLDKRCYSLGILDAFTDLLLSKGFKVDTAMRGCDRMARTPFTTNCKELDDTKNDDVFNANLPLAVPINDYEEITRYSVVDVFEKLRQLETIIPLSKKQEKEVSAVAIQEIESTQTEALSSEEREKIKEEKQVRINLTDAEYLYDDLIDFNTLPPTIKKILASSTPQGYRNETLKFLTKTLKDGVGLTLKETQDILAVWGNNCEPVLDEEFTKKEVARFWRYVNHHKNGYYSQKLVDLYGYLDLAVVTENSMVAVPHHLMNIMCTKSMNGGVIRTYMLLLLHFHENEEVENIDLETLTEITQISHRSVERHVSVLLKNGLLVKKVGNTCRKQGDKNGYYPSPYITVEGCRKIPATTIEAMYFSKRNELTDNEAMVFLYLKLMVTYSKKKKAFTSQEKIGLGVGQKRRSIINITDSLHEKKFIKKVTIGTAFLKRTTYEIKK